MLNNISVYAIADKYDIPTLKELAASKFENLAQNTWPQYDFPAVVKAVYDSTSANDQGLRGIVHSICAKYVGDVLLFGEPGASELRDMGQFGFDVLRIVKESNDRVHEHLSSMYAISEVELHTKTEEADMLKRERNLLKAQINSWSQSMAGIVDNARMVDRCRHCSIQSQGSGALRFEQVDHPKELHGILRCSRCATKHSLD